MQILFQSMKLIKCINTLFFFLFIVILIVGCKTSTKNPVYTAQDQKEAIQSVLLSLDSLQTFPFVSERVTAIKLALQKPTPVLLCSDSLSTQQVFAQSIALQDSTFTSFVKDPVTQQPYRNEIFGVYPARQSDMGGVKTTYQLSDCFRVEMYNYALNNTTIGLVDVKQQKVLQAYTLTHTQADISANLKQLAIKIAIESEVVQNALGVKPSEKDALMASTLTALNRTRCERSRHLCVAPTFVKGEKALWAIVDLTDHRLVGIRWTTVGKPGLPIPLVTERRLQDDKITACFCEVEQPLKKNDWEMKYMLTSSDGLRIADVSYKGKPVLKNAKLVDWHVSYSGTDGFGYSDAVGCPYFSQAAVVAWEIPKIIALKDNSNTQIGFVLEQVFRSEGWPTPCNYNYVQRYEFYNDGKFRISCASLGRGCGNTGTYRPVFRIAFASEEASFYQWKNTNWELWPYEKWNEQNNATTYTPEGFLYKIENGNKQFFVAPGNGQFNDGGRGDFSFMYVTKNVKGKEEGENDLPTIGPCCNTDYHQGPEKFIEPQAENIKNAPLVLWYVAQLRNDDRKGAEYCWAENKLENGVWSTKTFPCFAGPMFVPVVK